MAFDEEQLAQISNVNGFGLYRYDTLDSLATIGTSGYINNPDDHVGLVVGDFIYVVVWTTSIRFGAISVTERHVVNQVNAVTGDVELLSLGSGGAPAIFASGQWAYYTAEPGSETVIRDHGTFDNTTLDSGSSLVTSDDGLALRQSTSAGVGSNATVFTSGAVPRPFRLNIAPLFIAKFALVDTTDIRAFLGLEAGTFLAADLIAGPAVGIQFSTDRGDTNWQFLKNVDGVTQVIVDSGIPPDTSANHLVVDAASATSVTVRIMDATFTELASTIFTTGLPPGATGLSNAAGTSARIAAVKSIDQFFGSLVQRSP